MRSCGGGAGGRQEFDGLSEEASGRTRTSAVAGGEGLREFLRENSKLEFSCNDSTESITYLESNLSWLVSSSKMSYQKMIIAIGIPQQEFLSTYH